MSTTSTFEILSLKGGKWETDSVETDKTAALRHAQDVLKSKYLSAVKVIEEKIDDETGKIHSFIIFNKKKTLGKTKSRYTGPERRKGKEWRDVKKYHKGRKKDKRKSDLYSEIIKLIVLLGGILLGLIALIMMYVSLG